MGGTLIGGKKAAAKNLANDPKYYKKMGAKGGAASTESGFYMNPAAASIAGTKGGRIGKPGYKFISTKEGYNYYTNRRTGEEVRFKA